MPANPLNPRKLSAEGKSKLLSMLADFGDLSGFIFNRRTGRLVGGHQRQAALPPESEIHITERVATTRQGTTARGYVEIDGERHTYREMDWDESREKAAMIAANKAGELAQWSEPDLAAIVGELTAEERESTGLEPDEISGLLALLGDSSKPEELKELKIRTPPKMAWVMIGIPLVRFGEISAAVEKIADIEGTLVETTVSDIGAQEKPEAAPDGKEN